MTKRLEHLTDNLLKLAKRIENEIQRLERVGVSIKALEDASVQLLDILTEAHGIKKHSCLYYSLLDLVFDFLNDRTSRSECIAQIYKRLKQGRRDSGVG